MAGLHAGALAPEVERELIDCLPGLERWAQKFSGPAWDAESLLTDTIISFLEKPGCYIPGKGRLRNFLFSCLRTRALDANKTYNREYMKEFRRHLSREIPLFIQPEKDPPLWRDGLKGQVEGQLQRMPVERSTAFRMFAFEEMEYDEVAQAMGVSPASVKTHICRVRATLRQYLLGESPP